MTPVERVSCVAQKVFIEVAKIGEGFVVWRDRLSVWLVLGSWLDVCPEKSDLQIPQ
jgi:hypothetical protein